MKIGIIALDNNQPEELFYTNGMFVSKTKLKQEEYCQILLSNIETPLVIQLGIHYQYISQHYNMENAIMLDFDQYGNNQDSTDKAFGYDLLHTLLKLTSQYTLQGLNYPNLAYYKGQILSYLFNKFYLILNKKKKIISHKQVFEEFDMNEGIFYSKNNCLFFATTKFTFENIYPFISKKRNIMPTIKNVIILQKLKDKYLKQQK